MFHKMLYVALKAHNIGIEIKLMPINATSLPLLLSFMLRSFAVRLSGTQPTLTCSKLTIETLEQGVKYVQS